MNKAIAVVTALACAGLLLNFATFAVLMRGVLVLSAAATCTAKPQHHERRADV